MYQIMFHGPKVKLVSDKKLTKKSVMEMGAPNAVKASRRTPPIYCISNITSWDSVKTEIHTTDQTWNATCLLHCDDGDGDVIVAFSGEQVKEAVFRDLKNYTKTVVRHKGVESTTYSYSLGVIVSVECDGNRCWFLNGVLHREDGPAFENTWTREWYRNGKLHREDGPAIEIVDGTREWRLNGILHREDGPAIEGADGRREWYLDGKKHREDGPAVEYANGTRWWYLNGKAHRENGPAYEGANGSRGWYLDGYCHREDGPAVEYSDGTREWWVNGKQMEGA